jgi:hypothetical protein
MTFPRLRSGAFAQYPLERKDRCTTFVARFLDGGEQRFKQYKAPVRYWTLRLSQLSESELRSLQEFYVAQQGASGAFTFTDPWSGVDYTDCSFDGNSADVNLADPARGNVQLTIRNNKVSQ